jgi:hypothetical protein
LLQPREIEGVCEVPISFFSDFPGHYRHAQLCACSHREMRRAMVQAHKLGWKTFVIVSHSFELLRRNTHKAAQDPFIVRRFDKLCRYLSENRDMFRTVGFNDLNFEYDLVIDSEIPTSPLPLTTMRIGEQLARRLHL